MSTQPKTAWVLAGGGSYGAVQVGMLKALCAYGVQPDFIAGSSVGAINGAFYAGAPDAAGLERLERHWRRLTRRTIFPLALSRVIGALGRSDHLFKPDGLRGLLTAELPYVRLEQSTIPVHVMATDLLNGAQVCLSSGDAVDAVLASCAIPAIYPPVHYDGRQLIDGAVACNTPLGPAVELGATRVVLLPTSFACPHGVPPRGVIGSAFHALNLIVMRQLAQDTELYARHVEIVTVPPICPLSVPAYDFAHAGQLIDVAARSTRTWIERGGLTRSEPLNVVLQRATSSAAGQHGPCCAQLPSCAGQTDSMTKDQAR
jgi:NTE family protein